MPNRSADLFSTLPVSRRAIVVAGAAVAGGSMAPVILARRGFTQDAIPWPVRRLTRLSPLREG